MTKKQQETTETKWEPKFGFPTKRSYFGTSMPRYWPIFDDAPMVGWKIFKTPNEAFLQLCKTFPDDLGHLLGRAEQAVKSEKEKQSVKIKVQTEKAKSKTKKTQANKPKQTVKKKVLAYYRGLPEGTVSSYDHYLTTTDDPVVKGTFAAQTSFLRRGGLI